MCYAINGISSKRLLKQSGCWKGKGLRYNYPNAGPNVNGDLNFENNEKFQFHDDENCAH